MGAYSKQAFIVLTILQTLAHQQLLCSFWLLPQLSASIKLYTGVVCCVGISLSAIINSIHFWLPELQNCTQNAIQVTKNGSFQTGFFTLHAFNWFYVLIQLHPQYHAPYMGDYLRWAFIDKDSFTMGV